MTRATLILLFACLPAAAAPAPAPPADAALAVFVDRADRAAARWRATPLGVAAGRADLAALVDLAAACPGPATLWLAPDGSVAVIADAGEAAEALAARLGAGAWPRWAGAEVRPAAIEGRPAALATRAGADLGGWARVGPRVVAATTSPALERAVALAAGTASGGPRLAPTSGADLAVRVDLDRLPRPQPGRFDLLARLAPRPLDVLGRGAIITASVRLEPALTRVDAAAELGTPAGAIALLAALRGTAPRPALVPPDAVAFAAARFAPDAAVPAAGEVLAAASPVAWLGLQGANAVAGRLEEPPSDPGGRFLVGWTGAATWAELPAPASLVAMESARPDEAAAALGALLGALGGEPPDGRGAAGTVAIPTTGGDAGPTMAWLGLGRWTVAAFGGGGGPARALGAIGGPASAWEAPEIATALRPLPRDASVIAAERLDGWPPGPLARLVGTTGAAPVTAAAALTRRGTRLELDVRVITSAR